MTDTNDITVFREYRNGVFQHNGDSQKLTAYYDKFASVYDKLHDAFGYTGPRSIAEATAKVIENKDARILDCAAGTGLVGEELHKLGYTYKDALEPSEGLREVARAKQIYNNLIDDLVLSDKPTKVPDGTYDALVCGGGIVPDHMTHAMFPELTRMVKPGGYLIFNISKKYLKTEQFNNGKFEGAIQDLIVTGVWQTVHNEEMSYATNNMNEECFVYTVQTAAGQVRASKV